MKNQLLHTPEGVRDIYNEECEKKKVLQNRLEMAMECYGYHIIQTPTFEFFDIFGKEIGTTPSKNLYKFFDREGNTLVLRPDITPSIARAAAKYFMDEEMPIRLYYVGNTFINNSSYQGRLKENTQLGAEFIGDDTVQADAEIIAMAVECLQTAGLKEFQLSVGHSDFLKGLVEAAGISEEEEDELRELIGNKNYFGVEELVSGWKMKEDLKSLFALLGSFYNTADELQQAKDLAAGYPSIFKALERLEELHKVLEVYGIENYVSYELGTLSNYRYYTGVIFSGYTFGSGEAIVRGGRYDKLLNYFGKRAASIGFAVVLDQVMAALSRQKISIPMENKSELICYSLKNQEKAVSYAKGIRSAGRNAELLLMEKGKDHTVYEAYAKRNHREKITFMDGE